MKGIGERLHPLACVTNQLGEGGFFEGPEKLLEIKRSQFERNFLGWNEDVFRIHFDRYERSCFYEVEAAIFYEVFHQAARAGEELDFVENDEALPFIERNSVYAGQIGEK